ncbi:MAG: YtxH domain-containing protein [Rubrobacter sp.]|nr:YtxH domain-containing protein [Rubrobacter sp.]
MLDRERIKSFILGGIAGALAGILFAPRSGRELRGSVASRAGEARERSRETYFEARERAQERLARAREAAARREREVVEEEVTLRPSPDEAIPMPAPEENPAEPGEPPRSPLRDVSRDVTPEAGEHAPDEGSEELRRKIQQTRDRLRSRLRRPGDGSSGEHDG